MQHPAKSAWAGQHAQRPTSLLQILGQQSYAPRLQSFFFSFRLWYFFWYLLHLWGAPPKSPCYSSSFNYCLHQLWHWLSEVSIFLTLPLHCRGLKWPRHNALPLRRPWKGKYFTELAKMFVSAYCSYQVCRAVNILFKKCCTKLVSVHYK